MKKVAKLGAKQTMEKLWEQVNEVSQGQNVVAVYHGLTAAITATTVAEKKHLYITYRYKDFYHLISENI